MKCKTNNHVVTWVFIILIIRIHPRPLYDDISGQTHVHRYSYSQTLFTMANTVMNPVRFSFCDHFFLKSNLNYDLNGLLSVSLFSPSFRVLKTSIEFTRLFLCFSPRFPLYVLFRLMLGRFLTNYNIFWSSSTKASR